MTETNVRWVELEGKIRDTELQCPECSRWNLKEKPGHNVEVRCPCGCSGVCPDVVFGPSGQPTALHIGIY